MPNYCYYLLALIVLYNSKLNAQQYNATREPTKTDYACLFGWVPFAPDGASKFTKCIKVYAGFRMSWTLAEESCAHFDDAHLVTVTTREQMKLMIEAIRVEIKIEHMARWIETGSTLFNNSQWWIGLAQLCAQSHTDILPSFRFADGTIFPEVDKAKTIDGVPIKYESRDHWNEHYCVSFHIQTDENGTVNNQFFNVDDCSDRKSFVCEMPAYKQEIASDGLILVEEKVKEETNHNEDEELTSEFPCGRDPFYCPMVTYEGITCFHLLRKLRSWKAAEEECNVLYNSRLASMHSASDAEFFYKMVLMQPTISSSDSRHWIGLHRRNSESLYEWTDGTPFDFVGLHVLADEENERGSCAVIRFNNSAESFVNAISQYERIGYLTSSNLPAYAWTNQRCDQKLLAICQKRGYSLERHEVFSIKDDPKRHSGLWKCPEDQKLFRGMCYKLYGDKDDRKTFQEAVTHCHMKQSNLVSLIDAYEHGFVFAMLKGLSSDAWIGMDMTEGRMRWLDGEPLQFTRFNPNNRIVHIGSDRHLFQANLEGGFAQDACAVLDATKMVGYWSVVYNTTVYINPLQMKQLEIDENATGNCTSKKLPFVCEFYAEKVASIKKPEQKCFDIDDVTYCFLPISAENRMSGFHTFIEATEICASLPYKLEYAHFKKHFGELAQVDDLFQWSFLTAMALEHRVDNFFAGVLYRKGNGFIRTDHIHLRLTPWGTGEPDLKSGDCVTVKIGRPTPFWFMDDCMRRKRVVCRLSNEEPMTEIDHSTRCPPGKENWIHGKTQCYQLVTNSSLFTNGFKADHDCFKYYNSNLASFPTKEDLIAFKQHLIHDKLAVPYAFIGLIRQDEGSFAWKDASPLTFLNWAPGMPTIRLGRLDEECVQMQLRDDYSWQMVDCMQKRHFICSVPTIDQDEPAATTKKHSGDHNVLPSLPPLDEEPTPKAQQTDESVQILDEDKGRGRKKVGHNEDGTGTPDKSSSSSEPSPPPPSSSVSPHRIILMLFVCLIVVSTLLLYFLWQRHQVITHPRDQQIVQFDSLQNEEENGM